MSKVPNKVVMDTNVPKTASLAIDPAKIPKELVGCVSACLQEVKKIKETGGLVIDINDEIFAEYRNQLSKKGQRNVNDDFLIWVCSNIGNSDKIEQVKITKENDNYLEFPDHPGLSKFDKSDRKFIAVANAHPDKPPVLQAVDSKWWGWQNALKECGITVKFLCPDYAESKYNEKFGK